MRLEERDQIFLGRHSSPDDIEIARQLDSYVFSSRGKKYVDFVMGWCVGNFGWNNQDIKKRIKMFDGPDYVSPHQIYKPWVELGERLEKITPGRLEKSFRATGGTEAVEIALEAAMKFTERRKFISVEDAYHGDSIATRSIGSPAFGEWYRNPFSAHRMKLPLDEQCAEQVEKWLSHRDVAAVIMEPIICNLGVAIPTQKFMNRVQVACKNYGTLFILDEIATGFGRTGKLFATEHFDVKPDIICLGKALSGGYAPIGATVMTDEVADAMHLENSYYSTYGWHPLSVQAALATLDYLEQNFVDLEINVRETSHYLTDCLANLNFKMEPTISAKGLAIGVSFADENYGGEIVQQAKEKGLLLSGSDDGFTMFPALNITRSVVDEGLQILEDSI